MATKIPTAVESELLEKAAHGASTRELSQWLRDTKGIDASYKSVQRLLKSKHAERAEVSKAVLRQELGKTVLTDIERLEKHAAALDSKADALAKAKGDKNLRAYVHVVGELRKVTHTKLHFAGGDTPDDAKDDLARAEERLARRLDSLAARASADEGDSGDRTEPRGEGGS